MQSFLAISARKPTITIDPSDVRISGPKPPTLVRRIATRMVLGVVALSLFEVVVWMGQKYPSAGASAEAAALPEADVAIAAADSKPFEPSWFSPETFSVCSRPLTIGSAARRRAHAQTKAITTIEFRADWTAAAILPPTLSRFQNQPAGVANRPPQKEKPRCAPPGLPEKGPGLGLSPAKSLAI